MFDKDIQALTAHFVSSWPTVSDAVPAFYDNQPNADPPLDEPFVRFSVIMGGSRHYAGDAIHGVMKQIGRVWLRIYFPAQTGLAVAHELASGFAAMFRNQSFDEDAIQCATEQPEAPINVVSDFASAAAEANGMLMLKITIPFDSFRSY